MQHPLQNCDKTSRPKTETLLPGLIHPFQSSFIIGRKASDNVILTQEIIHSMTVSKRKQGLMALKIDLEKAFDKLEWNFIHHVLK